jgi:hypothetical protein
MLVAKMTNGCSEYDLKNRLYSHLKGHCILHRMRRELVLVPGVWKIMFGDRKKRKLVRGWTGTGTTESWWQR